MRKFTLLCLSAMSLTASVMADVAPVNADAKPVVKTAKKTMKKPVAKKSTLPQPSEIAEPKTVHAKKSITESIPFKDRVSVAFYGFNSSDISAADAVTQLSYKVMPGLSVAVGTSLTRPGDYYYGMIDVHSSTQILTFSPSFQLGYSGYNVDDDRRDNGLLVGLALSHPINHFSDLEFALKSIASKVNLSENEAVASVGIKLNF